MGNWMGPKNIGRDFWGTGWRTKESPWVADVCNEDKGYLTRGGEERHSYKHTQACPMGVEKKNIS